MQKPNPTETSHKHPISPPLSIALNHSPEECFLIHHDWITFILFSDWATLEWDREFTFLSSQVTLILIFRVSGHGDLPSWSTLCWCSLAGFVCKLKKIIHITWAHRYKAGSNSEVGVRPRDAAVGINSQVIATTLYDYISSSKVWK